MPHDEMSIEDMATAQAMNGGMGAAPVSGYIPATPAPVAPPTAPSVTVTTTSTPSNGSHGKTESVTVSVPKPAATTDPMGDYSAYVLNVNSPWPPPVFARPNLRPEERFYLENRWYSQWSFYDKKANESKKNYLRLQQIIVIGSVIVPVLVAFGPNLITIFPDESAIPVRFVIDMFTVVISTAVAVAAAWEGLHKNGDSWTTYRRAAEEMQQEKFTFDVRTGRYANNADAFARFVERCEEIMAQQNGRFIQTIEKQQAQQAEQNAAILDKYRDNDDDEGSTRVTVSSPSSNSFVEVETYAPAPAPVAVAAAPAPAYVVEDNSAG